MMRTHLTTDTQRMCARHPTRQAAGMCVYHEKANAGTYTVRRPACDACLQRSCSVRTVKHAK